MSAFRVSMVFIFQSTSPVRGTTLGLHNVELDVLISIHVPRAGDDHAAACVNNIASISIHVPRAGDDATSSSRE